LAQRAMLFPGAYGLAPFPKAARLPPGVAEGELRTADGETLRMLWRAPRPGAGVIVSFLGNGTSPDVHALRFATPLWADDGWGFLTISYRGYPGSTGSPTGVGVVVDGQAALGEAERRWPGAPILLHGHSLGAAVAIAVAADQDPAVRGVYVEAPFASVGAAASHRFWGVPFGPLIRDPMPSIDLIGHIAVPVVIVHGSNDGVIPAEQSALLAAAGRDVHRDVIPGADHMSVFAAEDAEWEPWFTRLLRR
jgi:alpha-beta hydrolase superfamily lysophospholipase